MYIFAVGLLLLIGAKAIGSIFVKSDSSIYKLAVGVLLNLLLLSLVEFYALVIRVHLDRNFILLSSTVTALIFSVLNNLAIRSDKISKPQKNKINYFAAALIAISVCIVATTWLYDTYWPVNDWDAITLYDFRGKLLSQKGEFADMLSMEPLYYLAYPLYTSLLHATVYILGYTHPSILYAILFTAYSVIVYQSVKKNTNISIASSVLFLVLSSFVVYHHSQIAYTNLPYLIYFTSGLFFLNDTIQKKSWKTTVLAAALIAGSTWVRADDPFWILPCLLFGYHVFKQNRWREYALFIFIITAVKFPWSRFKANMLADLSASEVIDYQLVYRQLTNIPLMLMRIKEVTEFVFKMLIQGFSYPLILFGVSIIASIGQTTMWQRNLRFIIITTILLVFAGTLGLSLIYVKWNVVGGSVQRMLMFLIPLILYDTGMTLYNEWVILTKKR